MAFKFNPLTGTFDIVAPAFSKSEIVKSILLSSDYTIENPVASIIFDEDSILFHDDEVLDD